MKREIESIKKTRQHLLELVKDLSVEQLNDIPQGFNNNIVWNLGHLVAAQQGLCYIRAGAQTVVDEKFVAMYKPGSKPEQHVDANEVEIIRELMFSSLDKFETDYNNQVFISYNTFTTRYGVEISNIDEALAFILFHEGLHMGYVMALKRVVRK